MDARREPDPLPIGAVVAALRDAFPDVTRSSLRFLEREGLLTPARSPGGHRLFSAADIERVRQIKFWQAQRLSLAEIRRRLAGRRALAEPAALAGRVLDAALGGDPAARRLLLDADDLGLPLARMFHEVLRPALVEVGARWVTGGLRVGQEHEVTEAARDWIAELAHRHAPPPRPGPVLLAACVAGEHHDLGPRMIVALLRARGHNVQFLGADVAVPFLVEEVVARRPAAVLLAATMADRLPTVKATAAALVEAASPRAMPIVAGGQIVPEHSAKLRQWGVVPASGGDLDEVLATILGFTARDDRALAGAGTRRRVA